MNCILVFKDGKEKTIELSNKVSVEGIKTIIDNRINNCTGEIDGTINFGTIKEDSDIYSIGDIKEIKINF